MTPIQRTTTPEIVGYGLPPDVDSLQQPQHFYSPKTKLIAWSLLRCLLGILETDTIIAAPNEDPINAKPGSPEKYALALRSMGAHITQYCNRPSNDGDAIYVHTRFITPFLEEYHMHYSEYGAMLPTPPSYIDIPTTDFISSSMYHLHALASGVHEYFYPSCFTYNNVPIQILSEMGHAALKFILLRLFKLDYRGSLENLLLFDMIAKNADVLKKLRCSDFVADKAQGRDFLEVSVVSNKIMEVLRCAAINSLSAFQRKYGVIVTNPLYRAQVERLHYMSTAS